MRQYQKGKTNLDFTGARESQWHWHQLGYMQICTSPQTDNHASIPGEGWHVQSDVKLFANLDLVDKFCYLGDMLSVDGDADAAEEAEFELDGINSGSLHYCLVWIYH